MDSISQVGTDAEQQNYPAMDLGQLTVEIKLKDQKIKDLLSDKKKLKSLLMKAKAAIDSSSLKQKQALEQLALVESKAKEATERNKDLL